MLAYHLFAILGLYLLVSGLFFYLGGWAHVRWPSIGSDVEEWRLPVAIFWPCAILVIALLGLGRGVLWLYQIADQGLDHMVWLCTCRKIQEDEYGELWRGAGKPEVIQKVRVQDSTGVYWVRVSPRCHTAHEAVAETYSRSPSNFHPEVRA